MKPISLQRPYSLSPSGLAIDVTENQEFRWTVSGDIQAACEVKVYDNSDNTLVWTSTKVISYSTRLSFPAGILMNGKEYKWTVTIYNQQDQSITSDQTIFQASSRPVLALPSLPTIAYSSYSFACMYQQEQQVPIRNWLVTLYNDKKAVLHQSSLQTSSTLDYLMSGLESEKSYYIEFTATSNKGLSGTTGLVYFSVLYTQPKVNIYLEAENLYDTAGVKLSWNIIQVLFKSDRIPPLFLDNSKIDTRNGRIYADEGLQIDKDFTMKIWLESPIDDQTLFKMKGNNGEFSLFYSTRDNRFHLVKKVNNKATHWVSTPVIGSAFFITIQQVDFDCNIYTEVIS